MVLMYCRLPNDEKCEVQTYLVKQSVGYVTMCLYEQFVT